MGLSGKPVKEGTIKQYKEQLSQMGSEMWSSAKRRITDRLQHSVIPNTLETLEEISKNPAEMRSLRDGALALGIFTEKSAALEGEAIGKIDVKHTHNHTLQMVELPVKTDMADISDTVTVDISTEGYELAPEE